MLWHHGAAVHRKRVNVRKRSKMLALANGSLIEMHTPRHWALTFNRAASNCSRVVFLFSIFLLLLVFSFILAAARYVKEIGVSRKSYLLTGM